MAVRIRVLALTLVLVGTPMLGALAHTPHDDAGTGADAPDEPANATNLTPGAYVGNLTPGVYDGDHHHDDFETYENDSIRDDEDWYRTNASDETDQLACTSASYQPDDEPHNTTRVHLRQPAIDARFNTTTTSSGSTLALLGPSPSGALAGLSHMDPPRVTQYGFELDVTTLDEAGGAGSLDEVPGPCFGGNLEDGETQEWTFNAEEGEVVLLGFGTELTRVDELVLRAPNGTEIGSLVSEDDIDVAAAVLDEAGNYTISAEAGDTGLLTTASSDYLVSFSLIDPEEEEEESPCRPHCMS